MSAKISALTSLAGGSLSDTDLFVVEDVSDTTMAGTGTNKKLTAAGLSTYLGTILMPLAGGTFSGGITVAGVAGLVAADIPTLTAAKISDFATVAASYGPVTTVASRTGTITLTGADIGAGTFTGAMKFLSSTTFGLSGASGPNIAITLTPGDVPNKIVSTNANGSAFTLNADDGTGTFSGNLTASSFIGTIPAPLTLASGVITTNSPALALSQTWNASGVQFQGLKVNITNSASSATSKVLDIQTGGVTKISTDVNGGITGGAGTWSISQFGSFNCGGGSISTVGAIGGSANSLVLQGSVGTVSGTASVTTVTIKGAATATSVSGGVATICSVGGTVSTTSTAGWTILDVNPTQTSDTSSGTKLLQRWAVGGTTVCSLDINGVEFSTPQSANPTAPGTDGQVNFYFKGKKVVFQLNDSATTRYTTIDLTNGTVATSTTPP